MQLNNVQLLNNSAIVHTKIFGLWSINIVL